MICMSTLCCRDSDKIETSSSQIEHATQTPPKKQIRLSRHHQPHTTQQPNKTRRINGGYRITLREPSVSRNKNKKWKRTGT